MKIICNRITVERTCIGIVWRPIFYAIWCIIKIGCFALVLINLLRVWVRTCKIHICTSCTERNNRLLPNKRIKTHCIPNANGFSWSSTHLKSKNHTLDSPHPKHSYNSNKHTHLTVWVTKTSKISKYSICHVLVKTFLTHPCIFF